MELHSSDKFRQHTHDNHAGRLNIHGSYNNRTGRLDIHGTYVFLCLAGLPKHPLLQRSGSPVLRAKPVVGCLQTELYAKQRVELYRSLFRQW